MRNSRAEITVLACLAMFASTAALAENQVESSACYAFAANPTPPIRLARFSPDELASDQVALEFVGHSTFRITTAKGVVAVTDYAGWSGRGRQPDIVTMNGAHETHFTLTPPAGIPHVLRGWPEDGEPADIDLTVKDLRVRNVTTDVIGAGGVIAFDGPDGRAKDANSIFVFEIADLCIGHLGHLHHIPTPEQFGKIGFLDVVLAPIDGVFTISQPQMIEILRQLRARIVVPMHYFGGDSLSIFVQAMRDEFDVRIAEPGPFILSDKSAPRRPTIVVMSRGFIGYDE